MALGGKLPTEERFVLKRHLGRNESLYQPYLILGEKPRKGIQKTFELLEIVTFCMGQNGQQEQTYESKLTKSLRRL